MVKKTDMRKKVKMKKRINGEIEMLFKMPSTLAPEGKSEVDCY